MKGKSILFLSTLLLVVLLNVSGGHADWWVNPSSTQSSSNCGSTQALACPCIANVLPLVKAGDVINLLAGVYTGPLNIGLTISVPDITIQASVPKSVIIDLGNSATFLTITVPGVVVAQVTIKNGITANVNIGVINIQLTAAASVTALLDTIKINNVDFLNIQGTAILCADVNVLDGAVDVKVNANIFVNVVVSGCSFVNVTVDPVIHVSGRISLKLLNLNFENCGSDGVDGAIVLADHSSVVVCIGLTVQNCRGDSLLDLNLAASLTLNGQLNLNNNVVSVCLINLNTKLDINILGLSVNLNLNTAPKDCGNAKCSLLNLGVLCHDCATVNLDMANLF